MCLKMQTDSQVCSTAITMSASLSESSTVGLQFNGCENLFASSPFIEWCLATPVEKKAKMAEDFEQLGFLELAKMSRKTYVEVRHTCTLKEAVETAVDNTVIVVREGCYYVEIKFTKQIDIVGDPAVSRDDIYLTSNNRCFILNSDKTCSVRHLTFKSKSDKWCAALCKKGTLIVDDCHASSSKYTTLIVMEKDSALFVTNTTITSILHVGVFITNSSKCEMTNCIVRDCGKVGVQCTTNSSIKMKGCSVIGSIYYGVVVEDDGSTAEFDDCYFARNMRHGISACDVSTPIIVRNCKFAYNRLAILHEYVKCDPVKADFIDNGNTYIGNIQDFILRGLIEHEDVLTSAYFDKLFGPKPLISSW